MKSKLVILLFFIVSIYIVADRRECQTNQFAWDKSGYYLYLPALFIYHDPGRLEFYPRVEAKYRLSGGQKWYSLFEMPTGRRLNKYTVGTALFELPVFLAAHLYCSITHDYDADGYTLPYQLAMILSTILWTIAGLCFLRGFLKRYFSDGITAATLTCIGFGTNLYNYIAFDQGMSHPYSFTLVAALLLLTDAWYRDYKKKDLYLAGIVMGLIIITRPVNVIAFIIPALWKVYDRQSLQLRWALLRKYYAPLLTSGLLCFLVCMIQMSYWKYATGHWIYYSYVGEYFDFKYGHIWKGLFGFRKGWFVYTPIALVSLSGLLALREKNKTLAPAVALYFVSMIYMVFSWREWAYGGGFSCRPLIETLPVAALPLAALAERVFSLRKQTFIKALFSFMLLFFVGLNLFQTYQYSLGIIPCDRMTGAYYRKIFGTLHPPAGSERYLMSNKEYYSPDE